MLELRLRMPCFHGLEGSDRYPVPGTVQKLIDHLRIQTVSGFVRHDVADDRHAREGEIPEEVENLVPYELIFVPEPFFIYY